MTHVGRSLHSLKQSLVDKSISETLLRHSYDFKVNYHQRIEVSKFKKPNDLFDANCIILKLDFRLRVGIIRNNIGTYSKFCFQFARHML